MKGNYPASPIAIFVFLWYTLAHTKSTWMSSGCAIFVEVEH